MPSRIIRNWVKKLTQKLQGYGPRMPLRSKMVNGRRTSEFRPTIETLEVRLTPTLSFNNATYASLQTVINAAESSGLADPIITITGSVVGGVTVGAFTNGTSGTLELTGAYAAVITAPTSGPRTSNNALIEVTGGISVELKGLDITGASASPDLVYGVDASGANTAININNTTIESIGSAGQTGAVYGVYVVGGASLTMDASTVTAVSDSTSSYGGIGVEVGSGSLSGANELGSATLLDDTINSYQADGIVVSGANGGTSSTLSITSSTITGSGASGENQTGILVSAGATAYINSSSITANALAGIYTSTSAATGVTISNDVLSNNYQGIYNSGSSVTATNDTLSSNTGGGVYNSPPGTLSLSNSTLSSNTATNGGGVYNTGTASLSNDTFTTNSATGGNGGSIYNVGALDASDNTYTGNTPSGSGNGIDNVGTLYNAAASVLFGTQLYTSNGAPSLQDAINAVTGFDPTITITGDVVGGVTIGPGNFTGTLTITSGAAGGDDYRARKRHQRHQFRRRERHRGRLGGTEQRGYHGRWGEYGPRPGLWRLWVQWCFRHGEQQHH
jgi:hypothetical protein